MYILNTAAYRSNDGGKTFASIHAPHGDNHALWIDPKNPKRIINGNDGGATVSTDNGDTWTSEYNQPTAQFYHVTTDDRFPYYIYGAQQDNSTVAIASASAEGAIDRPDWYAVGGGESGYIAPDPNDPEIVYAGSYGGEVTRYDHHTGEQQSINPWPVNPIGWAAADVKHRFQWTEPIVFSPHDAKTMYFAGEVLFKTTDGGMSWTVISSDLTRNDKSKQASSGGPITKDNTGVEVYDTIFSVVESPVQKDLIWAGTDDGLVQLTARWRPALGECDAQGHAGVGHGKYDRGFFARRRHCISRGRTPQVGRLRAVCLQDNRFRKDLDQAGRREFRRTIMSTP